MFGKILLEFFFQEPIEFFSKCPKNNNDLNPPYTSFFRQTFSIQPFRYYPLHFLYLIAFSNASLQASNASLQAKKSQKSLISEIRGLFARLHRFYLKKLPAVCRLPFFNQLTINFKQRGHSLEHRALTELIFMTFHF